jgi:hypothetical protein
VPTWLAILIAAVVVLAIVFFIGGYIAVSRRRRALDAGFHVQLEEANAALAAARAEDRGWEWSNLEAAARAAHGRAHQGAEIRELHLIQVIDRPGTEEDQARFRVVDAHGAHEIVLGRRGDDWVET